MKKFIANAMKKFPLQVLKSATSTILLVLSAGFIATPAVFAAGGNANLEHANIDLHDKAGLQRGAKYYVNYCMGCHSLKFSRYNRIATDLGLTDEQVAENFIFTRTKGDTTKVGELMKNAMPAEDSERWFGTAPPDLSLVGRSRGGDWIYSFLKAFYVDSSRPLGVNNTVFANAGMPHVLWELQGWQEMEEKDDGHGHMTKTLTLAEPGKASPEEYDQVVTDLTNFLVYVGEPAQLHRKSIGMWVLIFLSIFAVLAYFLKKEYWKDVH